MEITYGSDRNGLLCGYRFRPGLVGQALGLDDAQQGLASPAALGQDPGFVWLHFNLTDAGALKWMQTHLELVPEYYEALHEGSRSTRLEDDGDTLVAVVNDVAYEFAFDPDEIATLWLHVGPGLVVSARSRPLKSIDRLREAVKNGSCFGSSVAFLNHLLRDQADVLVRIVREATVKVDDIEDKLLVGRLTHKRTDLGRLRRVLVRLARLLAPEPGALFRLLRAPPPWIASADLDEMRQSTEEFSLVIRDLAALQERIKLLQEEIAAQVGEQTNRSVFTLTMVTVLALPINLVAGLFGMNVGGIPLAANEHGFLIIMAVVAAFTVLAVWLALRNRPD
ncbi:Mg2+/Co2+ transporter [Burkholderiales bacterium JOSHI_001]|nr:Mg2+/Co2+ transporter [Burkholderiales bacterium JOSHI_001]